jgi:hypothetical protein
MEPSLQEMWEKAERNFKAKIEKTFDAKTAMKFRRAGAPMSLEDVIREMESRTVEDESDGAKIKNRAKEMGQRVLMCIQLLGGIAAQGASILCPMIPSCNPVT